MSFHGGEFVDALETPQLGGESILGGKDPAAEGVLEIGPGSNQSVSHVGTAEYRGFTYRVGQSEDLLCAHP